MRMYHELARWWPLLSPPEEYRDEAADLVRRLGPIRPAQGGDTPTLLELGSGGGSLAANLSPHFRLTLTDRSPDMLAVSRAANPAAEHLEGDMLTLRLGRTFDAVLLHDAIHYAVTPEQVRAALTTAAVHCRAGGRLAVLPDCTRETFEPGEDHGGRDAPDGRALRYLEWTWDPDVSDDTFVVDYAFLLRGADGRVEVAHDRHVEGFFPRADWLRWLGEAGFDAAVATDAWKREVFVGTRRARDTLPLGGT